MAEFRPTKSQYHHFIPRFILRNFTHKFESPKSCSRRGPRRNGRNKGKGRPSVDEPMLNALDLASAEAEVKELPLSRTFGLTDMYRDFANTANQHYLEEELSKLESRAARIIQTIRKTFEAGTTEVWISRPDRNELRKFLFIMKYRTLGMHRRYFHENMEDYCEDDRDQMLLYMSEKGFKRPLDVWFDNIKGILDLKMDAKKEWPKRLTERIYPPDAMWYISHTEMMYLALCTPENEDDEFILTENGYGIHEGPVSGRVDSSTGKSIETYTEFHMFAVVSPQLIMVLRSLMLPIKEEDAYENIKKEREELYLHNVLQHNRPHAASSVLADLPVTKPRNSYTKIVNGRFELADGEDGSLRANHKFCFRYFPIGTDHVQKINTVMLEESIHASKIVFKSNLGFLRAVEYYLKLSSYGFKQVSNNPDDSRLAHLKKLGLVVERQGSRVETTFKTQQTWNLEEEIDGANEVWTQLFKQVTPKEPSGSIDILLYDMEQSQRMVKLRIKVDVWSKGLDESFREQIREQVGEIFCQLPVRRLWFYLKRIRNMALRAGHIFEGNKLSQLMWFSTLNQIQQIQSPYFDLDSRVSRNNVEMAKFIKTSLIVVGPSGSIRDCGIPTIEEKAQRHYHMLSEGIIFEENSNPFLTEEENIELGTRVLIENEFSEILSNRLRSSDLEDLKDGQPPTKDLIETFKHMMSHVEEIQIIIDVLDECITRQDLLEEIKEPLEFEETNIKILATGREEAGIKLELRRWLSQDNFIFIQQGLVDSDIRAL
ncbi:hypothetical protein B7463_g11446, partial [Scytalidium lignicola]